jgi:(R,R)-butanediol dehydrogenase/meso-butanediol dehydrogenase/diacetyl reductase
MRVAAFIREGAPLAIEDRQTPTAQPNELVLRVAYCGICGTDLHATEKSAQPLEPGTVLGHEFSGEVAESCAEGFRPGERIVALPLRECDECRPLGGCRERLGILCPRTQVIGLAAAAPGGYAEYVRIPAHNALRVPDGLDLRAAALTEPLSVGAHAVRMAGALLGARVLVIGAGPIGLATIIFARAAGARGIVVSELDATRRERALALGATASVDPVSEKLTESCIRIAGAQPDVVFECVGNPGLLRQCIDAAPLRGRIVVVGACRQEDAFVPRVALRKELNLQFVLGYSREEFALVLDMLADGRIDPAPLVTGVVGLDDLPAMFESLRRPNPHAKVLIQPGR